MQPRPSQEDVLLYQSPDGAIRLDVQLEHETVWLTQAQLTELFSTTKQSVSLHVRNIFREQELVEHTSVKESLTVLPDGRKYKTKSYNLDVIISVGYRVKSARGTQFRQWAAQVLRDFLVRGYALNERRLRESARQLADLKRLVQLQSEVAANHQLTTDESTALLHLLGDYARALDVLDQYDHQRLRVAHDTVAATGGYELTYEEAMAIVSARPFSPIEANRYAGALGDPARMAQNFAGVSSANDTRNDIVVRGNTQRFNQDTILYGNGRRVLAEIPNFTTNLTQEKLSGNISLAHKLSPRDRVSGGLIVNLLRYDYFTATTYPQLSPERDASGTAAFTAWLDDEPTPRPA